MDIKQVISFAQRNGYETVEKLNNWNGYECYEPIMDSKKETELGPPLLILVKGDKIRMSTPDEAFQQLDECYPEEDENDGYEAKEEKRTACLIGEIKPFAGMRMERYRIRRITVCCCF